MHLLFITRKWPPAVGGMETWSVEVAAALQDGGHSVEIRALPGRDGGGTPGASAIIRFGLQQAFSLLLGRWRDGPPAAILGGDMALWPLAWIAGRRARCPVVLAAHGTDVAFASRRSVTGRLYRQWLRLGAHLLGEGAILANSHATAARARALGFARVDHAPLGVRVAPPFQMPPAPEPFLLFAGRLIRRKGLSWFVRDVLPDLPQNLHLKVAGPSWDESESAALAHPRVEALGARPPAELHTLMARATAVIVPNLPSTPDVFEGFGLVAPEAAAAGAIVLAASLDGLTDAVIDGQTGTLLPPGDAAAWREKIAEIAAWPPEQRAAAAARAQQTAQAHFRWSTVADKVIELATA
ncbi:MAG: glycosyltransferase family 4 protein [Pseudomonadota bacterium]